MGKDTFLCVQGLTKRYGKSLVVDNLSFSVQKSEVFGLLGPNGAGIYDVEFDIFMIALLTIIYFVIGLALYNKRKFSKA